MYNVIIVFNNYKFRNVLQNRFARSKKYNYVGGSGQNNPVGPYELYFNSGKLGAKEIVSYIMAKFSKFKIEKSDKMTPHDPLWLITIYQ